MRDVNLDLAARNERANLNNGRQDTLWEWDVQRVEQSQWPAAGKEVAVLPTV
jgi:hypothetical protein